MSMNKLLEQEIKQAFKDPVQKKLALKLVKMTGTADIKNAINEFITS
jgi:hypothetical protein